ncbi:MAG: DUF3526 domain-containing protein [Bacteroidota bacterium]
MHTGVSLLIAKHFWTSVFKSRSLYLLFGIVVLLLLYAAYSGLQYHKHNDSRTDHQELARKSWENNPDKHPHRMAHFGSFAFRLKHPLSIFDFGIESYTGNAVFLEAHKQNMVNFSEASFSTSLLRFGELSMAMVLQTLLPLIIFFLGYTSIASDREQGTLTIMLTQGASWKEILFGKSLGLLGIAILFTLPFLLITLALLITGGHATADTWMRFGLISITYLLFTCILCLTSIGVSASSQTSKHALTKLLGIWLLMVVLIPRTSQALGTYFHPSPNKLEFRSVVEEEVIQTGDSHNPNDPLFNALRDSVLAAHQVDSVTQLPFNYGGFVMGQGEKLSSQIYLKHHNWLLDQYRKQNQLTRLMALVNPYLAIKHVSMAISASDFESYVDFQQQAESYRYQLAQRMNELQMKYISTKKISGSEGKVHVVNRAEWKAFPDFHHHNLPLRFAIRNEALSLLSILLWTFLSIGALMHLSRKAKAI